MLRQLTIHNFKSLSNFNLHNEEPIYEKGKKIPSQKSHTHHIEKHEEYEFHDKSLEIYNTGKRLWSLTCLIGLNDAGKSNILEALNFLKKLTTNNKSEIKTTNIRSNYQKNPTAPPIIFSALIELKKSELLIWKGTWDTNQNKMTSESIKSYFEDEELLSLENGTLSIKSNNLSHNYQIPFKAINFDRSSLALFNTNHIHPSLVRLKKFMDSLALIAISTHTQDAKNNKLANLVHQLSSANRKKLLDNIKIFHPQIIKIKTQKLQSGQVTLSIKEKLTQDYLAETNLQHTNNNTLRMLEILALTLPTKVPRIILIDEIENGVNPNSFEQLITLLQESGHQLIITTNNPVFINYLDDWTASVAVRLIYRNSEGSTRSTPFFLTPETNEKLGVLGAGEVFADTDIPSLIKQIEADQKQIRS